MSLTQNQQESGSTMEPHNQARRHFGTGRSELVVVGVLYALAIFLTIGTTTMTVQGKSAPGPQFFPVIVCVVLYLVATLLAIHILRNPKVPDNSIHSGHGNFSADMLHDLGNVGQEEGYSGPQPQTPVKTWKTYSDWRTVGVLLAGVVGFVLLLEPLGWIISATMLFWTVAFALGSSRRYFDIGVGLLFASIIQLAFGAGLGLSLPSGFIGGIL